MMLTKETIQLQRVVATKEEAIRLTGEILVAGGYVNPSYVESMLVRERLSSTYMGNFIAIPHGTDESKREVLRSGISIVQVPEGVDFGSGKIVKLLIGIAGQGDDHLQLLSNIAIVCSELANVEQLIAADTPEQIIAMFEEVNASC